MWAVSREAASLQAYATGARMNARALVLWLKLSLLLWLAATFGLIWYFTGYYFPTFGHRYFAQWFMAWLLTKLHVASNPVFHPSLPYMGRRYPPEVLYAFLNSRQFYQHSFGEWFAHYARFGAIAPALGTAALWAVQRRIRRGPKHLRGPDLLDPVALNRSLKPHGLKLFAPFAARFTSRAQTAAALEIGSVELPREYETQHFMIMGSPGAGKSTLIRQLLRQLEARGELAIVADPECEYVREFYHPERGDLVLNPLDARCPSWSPWAEIREEFFGPDAAALAATFVPEQPNLFSENSAALFFRRSSRTLIEAILKRVEARDAHSVLRLLAQPRESIKQALGGTPAEPLIDPGAHEQGAGIIATAANAMRALEYLPAAGEGRMSFSARRWAKRPQGWLFLSSTEDSRDAVLQLQAVWLDTLVRWLMAAELGAQGRRKVWIVADELSVLRFQPQLENLVTRGRKRGLCAVLGFQNISQLRTIYGRDRADTLASSPTTKLIMRCDHAETASWASEQIGRREVVRLDLTTVTGLSSYREGFNLAPHQAIEALALPGEVQMLKPLEAYLCIAGHPRAKLTIAPAPLVSRAAGFMARTMAEAEGTKAAPQSAAASTPTPPRPAAAPRPSTAQPSWN